MRTRNYPDVALGLVFALGGALLLNQALALRSIPGLPVGPGLFPSLTGIGMMVFGAVLAVQAWLAGPRDDLPLLPEQVPEQEDGGAPFRAAPAFFTAFVLGILVCTAATIFLMPLLGFIVTGALFVSAVVLLSGGSLRAALVFGPVAAVAVQIVFAQGFRVPLPRGIFG